MNKKLEKRFNNKLKKELEKKPKMLKIKDKLKLNMIQKCSSKWNLMLLNKQKKQKLKKKTIKFKNCLNKMRRKKRKKEKNQKEKRL